MADRNLTIKDVVPDWEYYVNNGYGEAELRELAKYRLEQQKMKELHSITTAQTQTNAANFEPSHNYTNVDYFIFFTPIVCLVILFFLIKKVNILGRTAFLLLLTAWTFVWVLVASYFVKKYYYSLCYVEIMDIIFGHFINIVKTKHLTYQQISSVEFFFQSVLNIGWMMIVYLRFKNANKDGKYILAMLIATLAPLMHFIPLVIGATITTKIYTMNDFKLLVKRIIVYFYLLFGLVIIFFPPVFNKRHFVQFEFIGHLKNINFYFFMYEIIAYLVLGLITYSLYKVNFKGKK